MRALLCLIGLLFLSCVAHAEPRVRFTSGDPAGVALAWNPNPEPNVIGYYVYLVRADQPALIYRRVLVTTPGAVLGDLPLDVDFLASVSAVNAAQREGPRCPAVPFRAAQPSLARSALLAAWGDEGALERSFDLRAWEAVAEPYVFPRNTPRVFFRVSY
jgi:hypothetical protein